MNPAELKRPAPDWLATWYTDHAQRLRAFVFGLLRDHAAADEVVQTTFQTALDRGENVRAGAEKSWLFQVAYNEAMGRKRRDEIHRRSIQKLPQKSPTETPASELLRSETIQQVQAALNQLPEEQRAVVIGRMYRGQTFQEIADETGLPLGTVLTRMRLALQKLTRTLQDAT
ncbi:RNA polymerase sigma factor [Planctomicrobium piriforme]|uniref:RNA polymerase sigma-70 factor, ECF subfamily n=1 Tax=Planctomicrobium piriforme TaxID=1576369 RepID=A0A1I3SR91_9PLAN|nr:RNA polymerase sigma factor [Planctomicrobium piriforme]SFJ61255.1 RNA polymerase sigma-70 factor, ECF subfamily [Planctomicrobium piriforme]